MAPALAVLVALVLGRDLQAQHVEEPLVNDPAADVTANDSQKTTTLVRGSASHVIAAFNDSGSATGIGISRSTDDGATWLAGGSLSPMGGTLSSPLLARDEVTGTTYLSAAGQFFSSVDDGASWSAPVYAKALSIAVDNGAGAGQGTIYATYTEPGIGVVTIRLIRSQDGGRTWGPSGGVPLSGPGAQNSLYSQPVVIVGADHTVYVFYQSESFVGIGRGKSISVRKSTDGGITFGSSTGVVGASYFFPTDFYGRSQARTNPSNGALYFAFDSIDYLSPGRPETIRFKFSMDQGLTWSAPTVLNDGTVGKRASPALAVSPDGSQVFVSWYDGRADPTGVLVQRWGAIGRVDGSAVTWGRNFRISNAAFPLSAALGDYDEAVGVNGFFYTTWGDSRLSNAFHTNQADVRFARIPAAGLRETPGDFNGDGRADLVSFDSGSGTWSIPGQSPVAWGVAGDVPVPADYNGDHTTDIAVWRPAGGYWYVQGGSTVQWGQPGDVPVPGDYLGAGQAQMAVFRPSNGFWYVRGGLSIQWGQPGDIPVPADYDGDGVIDIAVFRPSGGYWFVRGGASVQWGQAGDVPVPADYDGDRRADMAVYRPSATAGAPWWFVRGVGNWHVGLVEDQPIPLDVTGDGRAELTVYRPASGAWYSFDWFTGTWTTMMLAPRQVPMGLPVSLRRPVAGDGDGDRRRDAVVYRPSSGMWYTRYSALGDSPANTFQWGLPDDLPISADFDGDGKFELTVFRPSNGTWYIRYSSLGYSTAGAGAFQWGLPGDVPIVADFDGDGKTELTVWRPSNGTWYVRYSSLGFDIADAGAFPWGLPGDIPLTGDFDGDGKAELMTFRPSNGTWYVRYSSLDYGGGFDAFQWGLPGDLPISADFDGDGKFELTVFRPSNGTWYIRDSSLGYSIAGAGVFQWGLPGDLPIAADFDGDGKTELTVWRPLNGTWYVRYSSLGFDSAETVAFQWGLPGDAMVK